MADRLTRLEAVALAAREVDALWARRFGCTVTEMEAEIAKFPKAFSEQILWVMLARTLAALDAPLCLGEYAATRECQRCPSLGPCWKAWNAEERAKEQNRETD